MALRAQIVDFVRVQIVEERGKRAAVCKIGIVQEKAVVGLVKIAEDVIDSIGVEAGRATLEAVNFVAFCQEQLGQVRAILASAAGD